MNPNLKNKEYYISLKAHVFVHWCQGLVKENKLPFLSQSRNKILTGPNCDFLFLGVFGKRWLCITFFFFKLRKAKIFCRNSVAGKEVQTASLSWRPGVAGCSKGREQSLWNPVCQSPGTEKSAAGPEYTRAPHPQSQPAAGPEGQLYYAFLYKGLGHSRM